MLNLAEIIWGNDSKFKISQITLSNNTIYDRIKEMPEYILKQIAEQIQKKFSKNHEFS